MTARVCKGNDTVFQYCILGVSLCVCKIGAVLVQKASDLIQGYFWPDNPRLSDVEYIMVTSQRHSTCVFVLNVFLSKSLTHF